MAKNKQQRALFEVLLKNRGEEPAKPVAQARPAPTAALPKPAGAAAGEPKPLAGSAEAIFARGRVTVTYYQLAALVIVGLVLCGLSFVVGMHFSGDGGLPLPPTQPRPTFEETQRQPVAPGLVKPGLEETAVGGAEHPNDTGAGRVTPGKTMPIPVGPTGTAAGGVTEDLAGAAGKLRLRIAQLKNSDSAKTDRLRAFLEQNGVETDLVARSGLQFLYGHAKFASDGEAKAKAYKDTVIKLLKDFKKQTGIQVSTDAFFVAAD